MVTLTEIESYYKSHRAYITNYLKHSGANGNAADLTNDVFLQVIKSKDKIDNLPNYTWGIIKNKLKMLYRSADFKADKTSFIDGLHDYTVPDECSLCDVIDDSYVAEY